MADLTVFDQKGVFDVGKTAALLSAQFPSIHAFPVPSMVEAVASTIQDIRPGKKNRPQYLWLFYLAGRLKGHVSPDEQLDPGIGQSLVPFALLMAQLLDELGMLGSKLRIDWRDPDAVEIEWLQAWASRKLPLGSNSLEEAIKIARDNPLQLEGNRYFVLVVNLGFLLQKQNQEYPFILPVSSHVAGLIGTTAPTVGSAVSKAIRDGLFHVASAKYSASSRTARLFRFNFWHKSLDGSPLIGSARTTFKPLQPSPDDATGTLRPSELEESRKPARGEQPKAPRGG